MRQIAALIVAADELAALCRKAGEPPPAGPPGAAAGTPGAATGPPATVAGSPGTDEELALWANLARQGRDVWLVTSAAADQPPPHGIHRATSLQEAARQCPAAGSRVLVVGADPSSSIRFANRHRLTSVLIDPGGCGARVEGLEDVPDFTLFSLWELPVLLERVERDPADFEGTE